MVSRQVEDMTHFPFVERELILPKVPTNSSVHEDILDTTNIFQENHLHILDHSVALSQ